MLCSWGGRKVTAALCWVYASIDCGLIAEAMVISGSRALPLSVGLHFSRFMQNTFMHTDTEIVLQQDVKSTILESGLLGDRK